MPLMYPSTYMSCAPNDRQRPRRSPKSQDAAASLYSLTVDAACAVHGRAHQYDVSAIGHGTGYLPRGNRSSIPMGPTLLLVCDEEVVGHTPATPTGVPGSSTSLVQSRFHAAAGSGALLSRADGTARATRDEGWGVPRFLDSDSQLRGSVRVGEASEVQSAVQG